MRRKTIEPPRPGAKDSLRTFARNFLPGDLTIWRFFLCGSATPRAYAIALACGAGSSRPPRLFSRDPSADPNRARNIVPRCRGRIIS